MVAKNIVNNVLALPPDERLELVQQIWDSLLRDRKGLPLTDSQRQELDRRYEDFLRNLEDGSNWEEVKSAIQQKLRRRDPQKVLAELQVFRDSLSPLHMTDHDLRKAKRFGRS
jgi:putative addiction module component (TIGR02574 family)